MNKVIGIVIFKGDEVVNRFVDVSWVNFLIRGYVFNGIVDKCREIIRRIDAGKVVCVDFDGISDEVPYLVDVVCCCYKNSDGLASVIMIKNYKHKRIIIELAYKLINEPRDADLEEIARRYEDPTSVDKIAKVQDELDRTVETMQLAIEKVLERGENIEVLLKKTDELNESTKIFVNDAKKLNSCCNIL
jgi:hypothetical protein